MAFSRLPPKSSPYLLPNPIILSGSALKLHKSAIITQQQSQLDQTPSNHSNSFLPLIKSCSSKAQLLQIHARLLRSSLLRHPSLSSALLSRAAARDDIRYSRLLFEQIPDPSVLHYNSMLRAYSQSSAAAAASLRGSFALYRRMKRRELHPNAFSASFVLKSCARFSCLSCGQQVHGRIVRDGHWSDSLLMTSLMGVYAACGDGVDARRVFDEMPDRDTVSWNVLISCFARNRRSKDALQLFDVMQGPEYGAEPDDVTCLLLLQACSHLGALDFGERIHRYVEDRGYGSAMKVRNSLIAMYSRCGCVDKAYRVFCGTQGRNVVTWSAMISGLAMNGYGRDAIEAFMEMRRVGVAPDEQTFTGVLSACSHGGLVDDGLMFLDMMRFEYGLVPNVWHYGCIVDLLGRAGLLDRAYRLIVSEMGVEPDATIWRTLLGACRIYGHTDLGERVIEHLIELKAQQAGDYILLLNIYSSVGNWEKVADLRRLMKDRGIQTTPGCSTMEMKGEIHEFIVDDDSHPRKAEIYKMLVEIEKQLKIAGYVANMASELHDLDLEEKESVLSFHSEKLAIAFGILSTPPGTTLRIAKNLRTCVDCHNFAKIKLKLFLDIIIKDKACNIFKCRSTSKAAVNFRNSDLSLIWLPLHCIFTRNLILASKWPGSYCDTQQSCCYPSSGKPAADFGIHGLWPNYKDGSYPSNCDSSSTFDPSKTSDLMRGINEDQLAIAFLPKQQWQHILGTRMDETWNLF